MRCFLFFFCGSVYGADTGAGTAANAFVGIDDVFIISLCDAAYGAFLGTSAAGNAGVADFKSHIFYTVPFSILFITIIS